MTELRLGTPNEKQKLFLADHHKYVGYGGARGGGKSWVVRDKAKRLAMRYPGIKLLIVRRTYAELINNHINPLRGDLVGVARYNQSEKCFYFPGGSVIKFGYCASDGDLDQYQGAEYDVIFLDEATQLKEDWIKKITACMRGVNDFPKRCYMTCNPGGPSHGYIKRLFIDRRYNRGERADDYSFIQSLVGDNRALMESDPDYINQLEALPAKLRAAWLEGRWDVYEGQFFEEFADDEAHYQDRAGTHVIAPFEIPESWQIYRSFDFGYAKPFSCGWWAVDYEGRLYRILELYGCTEDPNTGVKWEPGKIFAEIARIEREHRWLKGKHIQGVADPSIWDGSRGVSVADHAAKEGIYFQPGINDRISGWMQVHYRLAFDGNGIPMMYVFTTCRAFIRTMPILMYSETRPEDLDTDGEDHPCGGRGQVYVHGTAHQAGAAAGAQGEGIQPAGRRHDLWTI